MPLGERFGQWQYRHTCCRYRHLPMKRIALILTEDFYATGVTATLDLLQLANGLLGPDSAPLFDWRLYSQDGQPLFVLNGIQTQSGYRYNLINQLPEMAGLVDIIRLSPQHEGTLEWLARFRANLNGQAPQPLAADESNGYWMNIAGMALA